MCPKTKCKPKWHTKLASTYNTGGQTTSGPPKSQKYPEKGSYPRKDTDSIDWPASKKVKLPTLVKCFRSNCIQVHFIFKKKIEGLTKPRCYQMVTCERSLYALVRKLFKAVSLSLYCGYGGIVWWLFYAIMCYKCKSQSSWTNAKISSLIASGGQSGHIDSSTKCLGDNVHIVSKSMLIIFSIVLPPIPSILKKQTLWIWSQWKRTKEGFCTVESMSKKAKGMAKD